MALGFGRFTQIIYFLFNFVVIIVVVIMIGIFLNIVFTLLSNMVFMWCASLSQRGVAMAQPTKIDQKKHLFLSSPMVGLMCGVCIQYVGISSNTKSSSPFPLCQKTPNCLKHTETSSLGFLRLNHFQPKICLQIPSSYLTPLPSYQCAAFPMGSIRAGAGCFSWTATSQPIQSSSWLHKTHDA